MLKAFKLQFFLLLFTLSLSPLLASFDSYLNEIEEVSRRKISKNQKIDLINFWNSGQSHELNDKAIRQKHSDFTQSRKKTLRKEWQENNEGKKWIKYQDNINCKVDGNTICRQKGWYYDMHHIIPQSHNGPHEWWNVFPLTLYQHNDIHKNDSQCSQLFPHSIGVRREDY